MAALPPSSGNPGGVVGQWGIYDMSGAPVLTASSVAGMEYARDWRVSNYPQEQGAFASYNKVKTPFTAKVTFLVGGDAGFRAAFLNQAEAAVASLNLVSVVTPEIQYASANLTHLGYRRTSKNGVTMLTVEIWCEEIIVISGTTSAPTASPNGANPTNNGITPPGQTLPDGQVDIEDISFPGDGGVTSNIAPPSGVSPSTDITTTSQQNSINYQYFNLTPPLSQNIEQPTTDAITFENPI